MPRKKVAKPQIVSVNIDGETVVRGLLKERTSSTGRHIYYLCAKGVVEEKRRQINLNMIEIRIE